MLEQAEIGVGQIVLLQADLDSPRRVVEVQESEFSVAAAAQNPSQHGDGLAQARVRFGEQRGRERAALRTPRRIGVHPGGAQGLQMLEAVRLEEVHGGLTNRQRAPGKVVEPRGVEPLTSTMPL